MLPLTARRNEELRAFIDGWILADRRPAGETGYAMKWADCPYAHSGLRTIYWQGFFARYLDDFDAIELALDLEEPRSH